MNQTDITFSQYCVAYCVAYLHTIVKRLVIHQNIHLYLMGTYIQKHESEAAETLSSSTHAVFPLFSVTDELADLESLIAPDAVSPALSLLKPHNKGLCFQSLIAYDFK